MANNAGLTPASTTAQFNTAFNAQRGGRWRWLGTHHPPRACPWSSSIPSRAYFC